MTAHQVLAPDDGAAEATQARGATEQPRPGLERVGDVLDRGVYRSAVAIDHLRARLPANPVPIYVGVAALAVTGVVSWPVAVAAGCGYAAFRRWEPQPHGVPHPVPAPVLA
jgi:hypothetical protein